MTTIRFIVILVATVIPFGGMPSSSLAQSPVRNFVAAPPVAATKTTSLQKVIVQRPLNFDFTTFSGNADPVIASATDLEPSPPSRDVTVAIDSVTGSDSNPGTLDQPKRSLQQPAPNGAVFGLYRGSLFRESLPFASLGTTHDILVEDLATDPNATDTILPIISALDPAVNGSFSSNGDDSYTYVWLPEDSAVANDGYANVYVVEVNTLTEALTPVASRRRMIDVASPAAVTATLGSAFVQSLGGGTWKATLHPTDGLAPGSGAYRYEVVARGLPANWGAFAANPGDGAMSGVVLVGGSSGYGSLGGPPGFVGDRLALLHASTHNAVLGGGSLQRSVFYEAGDPTSIQLAWYAGAGAGLRWDTRQCLFYANVGDRPANGLIAHTGGTSFERGDLSDTAFLGARWSDGSLHGQAIDYVNVAAGVIARVYVQGIFDAFSYNMPLAVEVKNSVFRQVNQLRCGVNFHDNLVLAESASDPTTLAARAPTACLFQQSGASATNNLFWAHGLASGLQNDGGAGGLNFYPGSLSHCTFARNILVINPASTVTGAVSYLNPVGADLNTLALDDNLVINLAKGGLSAGVGPAPGRQSWADYVAYEATQPNPLDQHSRYIDLSGDPRGLQAVFVDPANGDFRWAQTDVAAQCAAYCQTRHVGPERVSSRWPLVPSVDEAVKTLSSLR